MPMPHRVQKQLIRRRLVGKEGTARVRELRAILNELPGYENGPYGELRKWVREEITRSQVRSRAVHRDSIAVRREGAAQVALVGAPNAGKSSLLQALSDIQIKTGAYAFTTTRPVAATCRIEGVPIQLVEIPGLLPGAHDDRGGGRSLLGVLREADGIVYCHPASSSPGGLVEIVAEVAAAGIGLPAIVALTRCDETPAWPEPTVAGVDLRVVRTSVLVDATLDDLRAAVWGLTGLVRVHLRKDGIVAADPVALRPPTTVRDAAAALHSDLRETCRGARVWGSSARFPGQRVGRDHVLLDRDAVELIL